MLVSVTWRTWSRLLVCGVCLGLVACVDRRPEIALPPEGRTVDDVRALDAPHAEQRLRPYFDAAGVPYPPTALTFLGFKAEKRLDLWAHHADTWAFLRSYPMLAASGVAGPKLREGDEQVPEGIYHIEAFNPQSQFHLSLKLDYPNALDRQQAAREGREQLGGDIFIHGKDISVGCIALGDTAIEEVFVLVVRVGMERVTVVLAPYDLREPGADRAEGLPHWVEALYAELRRVLRAFPLSAPQL